MPTRTDPDSYLKALGAALRAHRERRGWSQEELGFEAELDRTYISGLERGVRNPTVVTLLRLCKALEVSLAKLLRDTEAERP